MAQEKTAGYRVLLSSGEGEIVEKKSRFIATLRPVKSLEEACVFLEEMKKKYWDARHNCCAYVIADKNGGTPLTRCNDDGEPNGTAGRPMLEVLLGMELQNVAVVVTRYFGGVLLGTGGLVRAYTQAVQEGIKACGIGRLFPGVEILLSTNYNDVGKILYYLEEKKISLRESVYGENVSLKLGVKTDEIEGIEKDLIQITAGRIGFERLESISLVAKDQ